VQRARKFSAARGAFLEYRVKVIRLCMVVDVDVAVVLDAVVGVDLV